jgi:hypothetical protein
MSETETRRAAVIEAARALSDALKKRDKPIPPDCFTVRQYAEQMGIARCTAHTQLSKLVELSLVEALPWISAGHRLLVYRRVR